MKVGIRWMVLAVVLAGTTMVSGCSGINTSHSISPASFFLPGLLKIERPKPAPTEASAPNGREFAQNQP